MNLTFGQLRKICSRNKYILLRHESGKLIGINCGISPLSQKRGNRKYSDLSGYIGYIACDLNTYISNKIPFITPIKKT